MSQDDGFRRIGTDPFAVPDGDRGPARRLRGRLAAPVTVWTAYDRDGSRVGITVSSLLVAEGDPPSVLGLVAPLSDFWEAARQTRRFVVHVLDSPHVGIADRFALRYPGDPFDGLAVSGSRHGPVLDDVATRVYSTLGVHLEAGYAVMVRGSLDDVQWAPGEGRPLIHYRGAYLGVGPRR